MSDSFGARLREQRERQHITLSAIAEQTKIKLSLLEALERDDVSRWPGGIFRRAFIRAYAHAIGLVPDVVVRDFLEHHPDPLEEVATLSALSTAAPGAEGGPAISGPPTRFRYLVGSAIGSLSRLGLGIVQGSAALEDPPSDGPAVSPAAADCAPVKAPAPPQPDFLAAAHLCTELGQLDEAHEALPFLQQAATILDAVGLIVWMWHPQTSELTPALAHGYSARVLAQLPRVGRDDDNATAAAFRSTRTCVVDGNNMASDALVVPLMTPEGCVGVFAIELRQGGAQRDSVRALVTIIAAQLARLVAAPRLTLALEPTFAVAHRTGTSGD